MIVAEPEPENVAPPQFQLIMVPTPGTTTLVGVMLPKLVAPTKTTPSGKVSIIAALYKFRFPSEPPELV